MLTLVDRHDYHRALTELPRVAGGTRAAAGGCANGCASRHQRPTREAILAGDRDDEAMGKENAMAVICGITREQAPAWKGLIMKIVVIGGSGLVGSKLVTKLREQGHRHSRRHRPPASTR